HRVNGLGVQPRHCLELHGARAASQPRNPISRSGARDWVSSPASDERIRGEHMKRIAGSARQSVHEELRDIQSDFLCTISLLEVLHRALTTPPIMLSWKHRSPSSSPFSTSTTTALTFPVF